MFAEGIQNDVMKLKPFQPTLQQIVKALTVWMVASDSSYLVSSKLPV